MRFRVRVSAAALVASLSPTVVHAQIANWRAPAGIPAPTFGIAEAAPAAPNPWTAAVPGFYYVDESRADAVDVGNTYGTPARPRKTIPLILPAGSVVELHGTYTAWHRSPATLVANGTPTSPVFIRGRSAAEKPRVTQSWQVSGQHFIVENIDFTIERQLLLVAPIFRGVLRHSTVSGTATGGGIAIGGGVDSIASEVVVFGNKIHSNGDWRATFDQDIHGIVVASYSQRIWILENELYFNSGDGVQINAGGANLQATTRYIYVGRNIAHQNKQTGFWTKQATDVIVSENLSFGHRPSGSSTGAGMGFQYAPERLWFLYNHIHDCEFGITSGSDSGQGTGQYVFLIGNVIHNIHTTTGFAPGSAWSPAGIMLAGGVNKWIVNNTIYDVDSGIQAPAAGAFLIANNIVSKVTHPQGPHLFIEWPAAAQASNVYNNLFGPETARLKWGGNTVYNVATFLSTFGKGQNSLNADPLFAEPAAELWTPKTNSPAIDQGSTEAVYEAFKTFYGLDIAVDATGQSRPQGAGWDTGAFEFGAPRPNPPTNVRIIK